MQLHIICSIVLVPSFSFFAPLLMTAFITTPSIHKAESCRDRDGQNCQRAGCGCRSIQRACLIFAAPSQPAKHHIFIEFPSARKTEQDPAVGNVHSELSQHVIILAKCSPVLHVYLCSHALSGWLRTLELKMVCTWMLLYPDHNVSG